MAADAVATARRRRRPTPTSTPGAVLDALDAVGLRGDGRLIQLNSYENRVFQVFLEDGRVVVAKFYRPGAGATRRSSRSTRFAAELARGEIPVAAPLALELDAGSPHAASVRSAGADARPA